MTLIKYVDRSVSKINHEAKYASAVHDHLLSLMGVILNLSSLIKKIVNIRNYR